MVTRRLGSNACSALPEKTALPRWVSASLPSVSTALTFYDTIKHFPPPQRQAKSVCPRVQWVFIFVFSVSRKNLRDFAPFGQWISVVELGVLGNASVRDGAGMGRPCFLIYKERGGRRPSGRSNAYSCPEAIAPFHGVPLGTKNGLWRGFHGGNLQAPPSLLARGSVSHPQTLRISPRDTEGLGGAPPEARNGPWPIAIRERSGNGMPGPLRKDATLGALWATPPTRPSEGAPPLHPGRGHGPLHPIL